MNNKALNPRPIEWGGQNIHGTHVEAAGNLLVLQREKAAALVADRVDRVARRIRTSGTQHGDGHNQIRTILDLNVGGDTRKKRQAQCIVRL